MKYASVYLNPSADRNPREKGKEQQIRRFAECQHSNGSEKYKTELLTTQGNKCSCGKNHTLMPISLIALWFRQRAERRGVWALRAALPQPGCRLGGWMLALPLVAFAFGFATCQCKTGTGFSFQQHREEPPLLGEGVTVCMCVYIHLCDGQISPHVGFLLSHLALCPGWS